MRWRLLTHGLMVSIGAFAILTGGCAPRDEAESTTPSVRTSERALDHEAPPPVSLPDLSRLAASVQDQVRDRYSSLQKLVNTGAPRPDLANAYGALGLILMTAEYYDAAAASYRHAQALVPDDMRWPYYLGQLYTMKTDWPKAAEFFERAVELKPEDVPTLVSLGRVYLDQGRPEAAEALFNRAVSREPRSAAALSGMGRAALARRDYVRATEYLERALGVDPEASRLHYPLAMAYRALGKLATARAHLQRQGGGQPTLRDPLMQEYRDLLQSPMAFERRGIEALADGHWPAAAEAFRKGLELEPDNLSLRHRLATALVMGGDTRGAIAQLEETLRQSPEFARAHFTLGAILDVNGRHQEAVERFSAALKYQPNYVEARMGLAEALRAAGRLEESVLHYQRVVAIDPGFADAWIGGADALVRLERYQAAREWLAAARNVHPDRPELVQLNETVAALEGARRAVGR